MQRFAVGLASLVLTVLPACSGKPAKHAGDARGTARFEALPSLDVEQDQLTIEMRFALDLSRESLSLALPDFERDGELQRWTDSALKQWLHDKQSSAEAASQALSLAAGQNGRQRIVAGALAGLVFERTARELLEVPPPSDLPLDVPVVAVFHEVMQKNAGVCLEHAKLAYAACAENALGSKPLRHWAAFCSARQKALPAPHDPFSEP
jgi:hypothetical protein